MSFTQAICTIFLKQLYSNLSLLTELLITYRNMLCRLNWACSIYQGSEDYFKLRKINRFNLHPDDDSHIHLSKLSTICWRYVSQSRFTCGWKISMLSPANKKRNGNCNRVKTHFVFKRAETITKYTLYAERRHKRRISKVWNHIKARNVLASSSVKNIESVLTKGRATHKSVHKISVRKKWKRQIFNTPLRH